MLLIILPPQCEAIIRIKCGRIDSLAIIIHRLRLRLRCGLRLALQAGEDGVGIVIAALLEGDFNHLIRYALRLLEGRHALRRARARAAASSSDVTSSVRI